MAPAPDDRPRFRITGRIVAVCIVGLICWAILIFLAVLAWRAIR